MPGITKFYAKGSNHGYVFQVIGDAFCAAFHTAGDGIRAALKCQMDLQSEKWDGVSIRVRMGIHTGQAEVRVDDGSYFGYMTLSRVARLMSVGCGEMAAEEF